MSPAVTFGLVLLQNGPGREFLGSIAITTGAFCPLLDVLVLALFFCIHFCGNVSSLASIPPDK
jgi:hypothetical protein